MCGIAGLVGNHDRAEAASLVAAMLSSVAHRGPDGEGIETWESAVLGHRRLAIFDLSELGRQPMMSPSGDVGIVFNGAIYNFRELWSELEGQGYAFKSQTDTEVMIHGYDAWGIDGLVSRLRGMFAFALWDERKQELFLVRDRLGVKPLVYTVNDGCLAFASTPRALSEAGLVGGFDQQAVAEYLEFGYVTDDSVIYQGAKKVPAASILEWSNGTARIREYWSPPQLTESSLSFEEAVEETERLFLRAVERRLQADVPVGALLSGGIDSSLVCWAIAKLGSDITAFTVATPGDPWDESEDAIATAKQLKIKHEILPLIPEDSCDPTQLTEAYAEPFACASALGMLNVSEAVKRKATVLLTGDGGDDVFLGYPEHRNFWLAQRFANRLPNQVAKLWLRQRLNLPFRGRLKRAGSFFDYSAGGLGAVANAHDGLPFYREHGLLGERLAGANVRQRQLRWSHESARNLLPDFLAYDRKTRFVGEYMTKVDGGTMFYGLEARAPFLDQDLWEFAAALPFELRLRQNTLKAILRELARRRIGERVASGRKRGFSIPVQRWLTGRWREKMVELMSDSLLEREGWIRAEPVIKELNKSASHNWAPNQLWYLLVLELWLRREQKYLARKNVDVSADKIHQLNLTSLRQVSTS
ncbi:MAG TPA: asparagine synthase (glutamine-hydrolyzing) [Pyrinomonadaceae bacterium]|nr:asparagine synthase (glutamine-hydrolyzing) [Pyrinomonadaceae bacterium]